MSAKLLLIRLNAKLPSRKSQIIWEKSAVLGTKGHNFQADG
jgi:hypothetical protein